MDKLYLIYDEQIDSYILYDNSEAFVKCCRYLYNHFNHTLEEDIIPDKYAYHLYTVDYLYFIIFDDIVCDTFLYEKDFAKVAEHLKFINTDSAKRFKFIRCKKRHKFIEEDINEYVENLMDNFIPFTK